MKSYINSSENSSYISKFEDNNGDINIHIYFSSNQPASANKTASDKFNSTTTMLPKSIWVLVKSFAAAIPKKTCDEAIQKLDQYFLLSLNKCDFTSFSLVAVNSLVN